MSTPAPGPGPSGPSASSASRTPHVPLSILDLVPISEGMDAREAIGHAMSSAQLADRLGFTRYWFAEHHNTISLASNATSLLIGQAAQLTERIRVGSGGIMLPNHSPLSVIEQFGTLVQMHGDRIDLGLGRAPGTDPLTAQLLARTSADPEAFIAAVEQMRDWSRTQQPTGLRIAAPVAEGTEVPMWILGSTANGAHLAGRLGMPFSVASHFSPFGFEQALDTYRRTFDADADSAQITAPHAMVGVNVLVAPTDEEAQHLFTSAQQGFLGILRGERTKVRPPRDLEGLADPVLLDKVDQTLSVRAVGSPETVVAQLESIVRATGADELIVTGQVFDPAHRDRSHELLAQAWGL
ncbi:LLM class flavin-dependent oxidoreductase [Brachybacterium halotolerans subsp. kimchii]|uniref:LLM class flavin-dependent oxidoreductase n=1 Tax=Brachybacterium halotolerans TaxID=2795215 RepID=UPI001E479E85|nr:LLM class flavin-dependent oxidoreductase [Brachybacterium halotolerans]UEJ82126.1 LLM class flavin-dependent oxidoreductase [Brachybacterium halotolerans subsp. kimchii]